jgi:hypothetical protein
VLSGHSAAALLDAECAPRRGAPAEATLFGGNMRAHTGLVVRRDQPTGTASTPTGCWSSMRATGAVAG